MTLDLLIRGGLVVDGLGRPPYRADVAVERGRIVAINHELELEAAELVDATGLVVTPGFIDVHTHYDAQVTWDDAILPTAAHGVTTIVLGNCGVGFAPVRPGAEEWLIGLMEGVEDIPGAALAEGIQWSWETFPEYLDTLAGRQYAVDVAAQLPHGALRGYVMGERGASDEPANDTELAEMARLVRDAIEAGAVGFSSSRTMLHQAKDGRPVPGTHAPPPELLAIGRAMREAGGGVFELVPGGRGVPGIEDPWTMAQELELMRAFVEETNQPITFSVGQGVSSPNVIYEVLEASHGALADLPVWLQFSGRSGGVLSALDGAHALQRRPTLRSLDNLPREERIARLLDPAIKAAILSEPDSTAGSAAVTDRFDEFLRHHFDVTYVLGDPPNYEPHPTQSVTSLASAARCDPLELVYDLMLERDGRNMLVVLTTNYVSGDLSIVETLFDHDHTVHGLGDGGAHVRYICDASVPTFLLSYWVRDRSRGTTVPIERVVHKVTKVPADLYGFDDRGSIEVGKRADINVIDHSQIQLGSPYFVDDLPAGSRRILQDASGYVATYVNGVATRRDDRDTKQRPGRLVRNH